MPQPRPPAPPLPPPTPPRLSSRRASTRWVARACLLHLVRPGPLRLLLPRPLRCLCDNRRSTAHRVLVARLQIRASTRTVPGARPLRPSAWVGVVFVKCYNQTAFYLVYCTAHTSGTRTRAESRRMCSHVPVDSGGLSLRGACVRFFYFYSLPWLSPVLVWSRTAVPNGRLRRTTGQSPGCRRINGGTRDLSRVANWYPNHRTGPPRPPGDREIVGRMERISKGVGWRGVQPEWCMRCSSASTCTALALTVRYASTRQERYASCTKLS